MTFGTFTTLCNFCHCILSGRLHRPRGMPCAEWSPPAPWPLTSTRVHLSVWISRSWMFLLKEPYNTWLRDRLLASSVLFSRCIRVVSVSTTSVSVAECPSVLGEATLCPLLITWWMSALSPLRALAKNVAVTTGVAV